MSTQVLSPFPLFTSRIGLPLTAGFVYIGVANQDPETNPQQAYWDQGLTTPATQPLRTDGGYIVNSGNPSTVFTADAFSIRVRDRDGLQVFYRAYVESADVLRDLLAASSGSSLIGFIQAGAGATATTVQTKLREHVSVRDFGAVGDGTTDDTSAFVACYTYCSANGKTMYVPAGTYRAWLVITSSNVSIIGDGSAVTTIKLPNNASHTIVVEAGPGTQTGVPCVLDFGQIGAGNSAVARSGAHISGLTLDGNKANTSAPLTDLFGWGLTFTKFSNVTYDDIVAQNCHAGGILTAINSNYHNGSNWHVIACGFNLGHPGFDVNSSKYSVWSGVSDACKDGARFLDNVRNCSIDVSIANANRTGFIYNNQLDATPGGGNFSENNDIVVRIDGGCSTAGVQVGAKCASGTLSANMANITGIGIQEVKQTNVADNARGIHYTIATIRGGQGSCSIGGDSGVWDISTLDDGTAVSPGAAYAVDVFGDANVLRVTYQDAGTKLRGVQFNSGADNNRLVSYTYGNTVLALLDSGSGNKYTLTGSATYDPPSLADGAGTGTTVAVGGAKLGHWAQASFSNDLQNVTVTAYVSASDVVTVRFQNESGGVVDLASGTLRALVTT